MRRTLTAVSLASWLTSWESRLWGRVSRACLPCCCPIRRRSSRTRAPIQSSRTPSLLPANAVTSSIFSVYQTTRLEHKTRPEHKTRTDQTTARWHDGRSGRAHWSDGATPQDAAGRDGASPAAPPSSVLAPVRFTRFRPHVLPNARTSSFASCLWMSGIDFTWDASLSIGSVSRRTIASACAQQEEQKQTLHLLPPLSANRSTQIVGACADAF